MAGVRGGPSAISFSRVVDLCKGNWFEISQHRGAHLRLENGSLTVPAKCKIRREGEEGLKCNTSISLKQASIRSLGISMCRTIRTSRLFWTDALWFGNVRIKPAVTILIVLFNASHHMLVHPKHSLLHTVTQVFKCIPHTLLVLLSKVNWTGESHKTWPHFTLKFKKKKTFWIKV